MAKEEIIGIVKSYPVGRSPDSLVVVIPKEIRERLKIRSREKFHVKIDDAGRIIYERLESYVARPVKENQVLEAATE